MKHPGQQLSLIHVSFTPFSSGMNVDDHEVSGELWPPWNRSEIWNICWFLHVSWCLFTKSIYNITYRHNMYRHVNIIICIYILYTKVYCTTSDLSRLEDTCWKNHRLSLRQCWYYSLDRRTPSEKLLLGFWGILSNRLAIKCMLLTKTFAATAPTIPLNVHSQLSLRAFVTPPASQLRRPEGVSHWHTLHPQGLEWTLCLGAASIPDYVAACDLEWLWSSTVINWVGHDVLIYFVICFSCVHMCSLFFTHRLSSVPSYVYDQHIPQICHGTSSWPNGKGSTAHVAWQCVSTSGTINSSWGVKRGGTINFGTPCFFSSRA